MRFSKGKIDYYERIKVFYYKLKRTHKKHKHIIVKSM